MVGKVVLVGAGCGRGLVTVKGLDAVRGADVVVYDALLDEALLLEAKPECERIFVGKRCGRHGMRQGEIQDVLFKKAREGKVVVRLKGGDGFVFGRGGEEAIFLQENGIPFEVIPGVSSVVAVPEGFGIPVTHRGVASSFTVVNGHGTGREEEDYAALAKLNGTLVFVMGLRRVGEIAADLMANGKDKDTPAAVLSRGFMSEARRFDGTLETIGNAAESAKAPAILLVGDTAQMYLKSEDGLPLSGANITITGTVSFVERLEPMLAALGASVQARPTLRIVPQTKNIPDDFSPYDWMVFTSANGVDVFFRYLRDREMDWRNLMHLKFACIGDGTAQRLLKFGFRADYMPETFTTEALGEGLAARISGDAQQANHSRQSNNQQTDDTQQPDIPRRLLVLRAENGSPALFDEWNKAGIRYEERKIYRTESVRYHEKDDAEGYLVFASAAGVRAWFDGGESIANRRIVCIGNQTAGALYHHEKLQKATVLVAKIHTAAGIAETILADWEKRTAARA